MACAGGSPPHRLGRVGTRSPVGAGSVTSAAGWQTAWRAQAEQVQAAVRSLPPLKRQRQRQCRWAGLTGVSGTDFRCEGAADGLGVTVDCADSVAGRRRGGKASERPLGSGVALSVVAVAAVGMLGCGWVQWANGKCFCV